MRAKMTAIDHYQQYAEHIKCLSLLIMQHPDLAVELASIIMQLTEHKELIISMEATNEAN
jgi:hypothetical protein